MRTRPGPDRSRHCSRLSTRSDATAVLLLACDMPFVEVPLLRLFAEWPGTESVAAVADGRAQYALRAVRSFLAGRGPERAPSGHDVVPGRF